MKQPSAGARKSSHIWLRYAFVTVLAAAELPLGVQVRDGLLKLMGGNGLPDNYLCTIDQDEKKFNSNGSVKTSESRCVRLEVFEGDRAGFVIQRNGAAVLDSERKTQEAGIRKAREEKKNLSAVERAKRLKEREKRASEQSGFVAEFPEAFDFKLLEKTTINGRSTLLVAFTPRAGYKPGSLRARVLLKARGKAWLDEQEKQLTRFEGEIFEDMSFGGVIANIGKGTVFQVRRIRLGGGEWALEYRHTSFSARLMLVKSFREDDTSTYSGFTKMPGK